MDPESIDRVQPQDLLALPAICRGFSEQATIDGKEILQMDGDEPDSLGWCVSLLRQCYNPQDLIQERDKAMSEIRYLLRPVSMLREAYVLRSGFESSTKSWFMQAFDTWYVPSNLCADTHGIVVPSDFRNF